MARRLIDQYRPGQVVEIHFAADPAGHWRPGRVARLDFPGVWVETEDGRQWFVTNQRHIRPRPLPKDYAV
ncbi:MAG: hypothetical protein L0332_04145 [Chloroflexi bacterium]|nr:hypothetical protein [Chloroflexota bacterium]MCI0575941.1 hypothetical protein [Chloroflexota bacterium]MCI0643722.1 hypothetical protein [Chloroflexota bacterium]MCI0725901.1 hypothetical protein [Chloroflexota bacterium]